MSVPPKDSRFRSMIAFHTVTSVTELVAGASLLCLPSTALRALVGVLIDAPIPLTVARVAGAGLLSLGIACWLARDDVKSCSAKGLVAAMLVYDLLVPAILAYAGLGAGLKGVALWPAVVLHLAMSAWAIVCLNRR
ncbi:hypothetical protein [Schlesneria paludicola]|uniref:hypothetical protein n=1 Tax=Schlesneria paludicola TaxID=360056 RepID=UPI000299CF7A|nr:hypothetical protein [Schlesneria paludicola]